MAHPLLRTYERLLAAYPADFRAEYGDDMVQLLGDQLRSAGTAEGAAIFARALGDLARTAPREHFASRPQPAVATPGGAPVTLEPRPRRPDTGPTRRDFLRASLAVVGVGLGASVTASSLGFLWPSLKGAFGAIIDIGTPAQVADGVAGSGGTFAVPAARSYLVGYDPADDPDARYAEITGGLPFMALYQRCVHLGCRVPWCTSSTRFECPCHKSRYNRWGEWQDGPAPRGLDRFAIQEVDGKVLVDTRSIVTGPARTGGVLEEGPTGASCLAL